MVGCYNMNTKSVSFDLLFLEIMHINIAMIWVYILPALYTPFEKFS